MPFKGRDKEVERAELFATDVDVIHVKAVASMQYISGQVHHRYLLLQRPGTRRPDAMVICKSGLSHIDVMQLPNINLPGCLAAVQICVAQELRQCRKVQARRTALVKTEESQRGLWIAPIDGIRHIASRPRICQRLECWGGQKTVVWDEEGALVTRRS